MDWVWFFPEWESQKSSFRFASLCSKADGNGFTQRAQRLRNDPSVFMDCVACAADRCARCVKPANPNKRSTWITQFGISIGS